MFKWFNRYNFPYSNFHDLNLDWLIKEMKRLIDEWEILKAEWEQMKIEWVEFKAEMQRLWEEYKDLMEAAWEAYKANLNQEWADYKDEMNQSWTNYQNALNQAWADYQADLNGQWIIYQNTLDAAWSDYQDAMNEWKDGVDQDIQDKFDEIDAKCAECQAAVQAAIDTLNNLLTTVQQQVEDYLANLPYETIIREAAMEWLDEHGITVEDVFLTPEEFGAVGDGVANDTSALNAVLNAAIETGKPIMFRPGATYKRLTNYIIPENIFIEGNGATIVFGGSGEHAIEITGSNVTIKNLTTTHITNFGQTIDDLHLENLILGSLELGVNTPSANRVRIKNVILNGQSYFGSGSIFTLGGNPNYANDFIIEDLLFNNPDSATGSAIGNGFIRGLATAAGLNPATFYLLALNEIIMVESDSNITLNKDSQVGAKDVKMPVYTTL